MMGALMAPITDGSKSPCQIELSYLPFLTMMFLHIHGDGCYIYINVSEIHLGNCVRTSLLRIRRISFEFFSHPS